MLTALVPRDRALWAAAFFCGLRRGELIGLTWEDVDLASGESMFVAAGMLSRVRSSRSLARVIVKRRSRPFHATSLTNTS